MAIMGAAYCPTPDASKAVLYMLLESTRYVPKASNHLYSLFCHSIAYSILPLASATYIFFHRRIKIMRFGQQFLPPLALGIVVAIATTPVVLQVPGLQIQSFPTPTLTPTSVNISGEEDAIIEDRARYGQPAQKPLNGCPQMFDAPTLDCSLCGGEDPSAPGTCTDPLRDGGWKCACTFVEH